MSRVCTFPQWDSRYGLMPEGLFISRRSTVDSCHLFYDNRALHARTMAVYRHWKPQFSFRYNSICMVRWHLTVRSGTWEPPVPDERSFHVGSTGPHPAARLARRAWRADGRFRRLVDAGAVRLDRRRAPGDAARPPACSTSRTWAACGSTATGAAAFLDRAAHAQRRRHGAGQDSLFAV